MYFGIKQINTCQEIFARLMNKSMYRMKNKIGLLGAGTFLLVFFSVFLYHRYDKKKNKENYWTSLIGNLSGKVIDKHQIWNFKSWAIVVLSTKDDLNICPSSPVFFYESKRE